MKKVVALQLVTLFLLVGYFVADFKTAPMSPAGWIKSELGLSAVKQELASNFNTGGIGAIEQYCKFPVKKYDFWYTCSGAINGSILTNKEATDIKIAYISMFVNFDEALDRTVGRTYYIPNTGYCDTNDCYEPSEVTYKVLNNSLHTAEVVLASQRRNSY